MQNATQNTPDGYRKDAKGRLIPIESIKEIDLARDSLVVEIINKALDVNKMLAQFKSSVFADTLSGIWSSVTQTFISARSTAASSLKSRLVTWLKNSAPLTNTATICVDGMPQHGSSLTNLMTT